MVILDLPFKVPLLINLDIFMIKNELIMCTFRNLNCPEQSNDKSF